jgi:hypothetical protein
MVLVMPTWIIYDLQIPRTRKIMAISFLSLGGIVIVVGILRMIYLVKAVKGTQTSYSIGSSFSQIEVAVAIIAASGPTVKWILSPCIPAFRSLDYSTRRPSGYKPSELNGTPEVSRGKPGAYYDLESSDKGTNASNKALWLRMHAMRDQSALSNENEFKDAETGIMKRVDVHILESTASVR